MRTLVQSCKCKYQCCVRVFARVRACVFIRLSDTPAVPNVVHSVVRGCQRDEKGMIMTK